jgi:hypothetical protein
MAIYLSMQRVRFSSAAGYEKFKSIFADVPSSEGPAGILASHMVGPCRRSWLVQRSQLLD